MKSHQSILLLILLLASSILMLRSGTTNLQRDLKNKLHQHIAFHKMCHTTTPGDLKRQDEARSMNAEMRITRGSHTERDEEKRSLEPRKYSTDREPTSRRPVQDPIHSRILHFPLQPLDLTISPAEAALHSATIAAK